MPWRGLEPRRLSAPPPQDGVSTNFTTRAETTGNGERATGNRSNTRFPVPTSLIPPCTGLTGLEPATSGVTDRHSNQAELQPQYLTCTCTCLTTTPAFHSCCTRAIGS